MKLEILGTGCAKCHKLVEQTELAANELGIPFELVKVTELKDILRHGVMITPALVVDGVVKVVGKVPSVEEVKSLLK